MARPDSGATGILFVDKPAGMSSHSVVARVRRWLGTKKVGHAGTLDPMATGLLVLGVGRGTKLLTYIVGASKVYEATVRLGSSTPTDDADSPPDRFADPQDLSAVTVDHLEAAMSLLRGRISQVPSAVSAIKVDGKRAYARVRAGEDVSLAARSVEVTEFVRVSDLRPSPGGLDVDVRVACSSGTYVRALARDVGAELGVGGHLSALRRTQVGDWSVDQATALPDDLDAAEPPSLRPLLRVAGDILPVVGVDAQTALHLQQGKLVDLPDAAAAGLTAVGSGDELICIAEPRGPRFKSVTGIATLAPAS